jgi:hypothetical protein
MFGPGFGPCSLDHNSALLISKILVRDLWKDNGMRDVRILAEPNQIGATDHVNAHHSAADAAIIRTGRRRLIPDADRLERSRGFRE